MESFVVALRSPGPVDGLSSRYHSPVFCWLFVEEDHLAHCVELFFLIMVYFVHFKDIIRKLIFQTR